ncbi:hypothetical protein N7481_000088 [Penicillium waksmanii]|uniref:uncharacterized protein n=1 Tax=Penicillium waksmanii TaxID=69791 RepID=UPI0025471290|nr:uncharacterized protein N7481_000088 [Penicillium waksmanii]KAJ5999679.1 hypothetical protein N7481_000088 [Penicillium waksmanii]
MSLPKPSRSNTGQLPKSVKVRSTCNACQQAKIRCSHEKPSCRRCQKHKIDCIYSVSRRLGRPAKKKERMVMDEMNGSPTQVILEQDREKKARKPAKKKIRSQQPITSTRSRVGRPPENGPTDAQTLAKSSVEEYSGFELDITSEGWLQELMATRVNGNANNNTLTDYRYDDFDLEEFDSISECLMHSEPLVFGGSADGQLSISTGFQFTSPPMQFENELDVFQSTPSTERIDALTLGNIASIQWPYDSTPQNESDTFLRPLSPGFNNNDVYSPQDTDFPVLLEAATNFNCGCYKQVISELVRFELKTGPNGVSSIDSILACQKELLLQTESILQCNLCSQSEAQANALMVIIVIIDSLLTTLDASATSGKPVILEAVPESNAQVGRRQQKDGGNCLKSHIDTCPLLVGGFQVPVEEKSCFIRQVLQARLSMLLLTVRRIRMCMQQQLAAAFSRGRLLMIMETDRRLQLIMMKIKMAVG